MDSIFSCAPVSVVIPCFNASHTLRRAVDSVINQTLPPFELVLIDDASTDQGKTLNLIKSIEKNILNLKKGLTVKTLFLQKNVGPGGARNAGWNISSQRWVAFLDADDSWAINKLAFQYECAFLNVHIDVLAHRSTQMSFSSDLFQPIAIKGHLNSIRVSLLQMLISNVLPTRSILLKREIPFRFPENTLSEDYSLWLKIIAAGYDVRLMDCSLAFTFRPEYSIGGTSAQLWLQEQGELRALTALYKANSIAFLTFFLATAWSLLKFVRRFIIRNMHFKA